MWYIWVNIGSGNGLAPVRCQAITWTNLNYRQLGLFAQIQWILNQHTNIPLKKRHLEMYCRMATISSALSVFPCPWILVVGSLMGVIHSALLSFWQHHKIGGNSFIIIGSLRSEITQFMIKKKIVLSCNQLSSVQLPAIHSAGLADNLW